MDPKDLRFTKTHEWVHLDGDVATIGISRFAVD
ncbi:MAG: glycine cleavage system protein H, partial [Planctomycetaceae bacterium]|nr:glycine cleavage system protein H [Planctomycetaceae bacterium]